MSGPTNVNLIPERLGLPQASVIINVHVLEEAGLVETESRNARRGTQNVCRAIYDELIVVFRDEQEATGDDVIDAAVPVGPVIPLPGREALRPVFARRALMV